MIFLPAAPDANYQAKMESSTLVVGILPVIFGFRVVAGHKGNCGNVLEWCCGDRKEFIQSAYSRMVYILSKRWRRPDPFEGIPKMSSIKPCFYDLPFLKRVLDLSEGFEESRDTIVIPDLNEIRSNYLKLNSE